MKKCCSWLPEAVAIAGVALGVGVAFQGWPSWLQADGQALAAWVQAVGSVAAIAAAIWIAHDQHARAEKRSAKAERDEVRNFLAGIREELHTNWLVYMTNVGNAVAEAKPDAVVEWTWPVPENPFKVYSATVGMLGRVPEDELRKAIVATYIVAGGLMLTWKMHNSLREARDAEPERIGDKYEWEENGAWCELQRKLLAYSGQLKRHQGHASEMIADTITMIDSYLKRPTQAGSI